MEYAGKRRKLILERVKAQLREEEDRLFLSDIDCDNWNGAFDMLNERFWNGSLQKIPVLLTAQKKSLGLYFHNKRIELATNKSLVGTQMLGVLLHEMCHHSVEQRFRHGGQNGRGGRVIGHGKEWKAEMRRVGYTGKITRYTGSERFMGGLI